MIDSSQGDAAVNPVDTTVIVSRSVSKPIKQIWKRLVAPEGAAALLGPGGVLGEKGDSWRAENGTYGMIRSFHPLEQIRFSWHAADEAPRTMVVVNLTAAGDSETTIEIRHELLPYYFDAAGLTRRWEQALDAILGDEG